MTGRAYREIRVAVYATEAETAELAERIGHLLCPDPEHAPPCPIPWATSSGDLDEDDPWADTLRDQVAAEQSPV